MLWCSELIDDMSSNIQLRWNKTRKDRSAASIQDHWYPLRWSSNHQVYLQSTTDTTDHDT